MPKKVKFVEILEVSEPETGAQSEAEQAPTFIEPNEYLPFSSTETSKKSKKNKK